jgi:hypothetical protein
VGSFDELRRHQHACERGLVCERHGLEATDPAHVKRDRTAYNVRIEILQRAASPWSEFRYRGADVVGDRTQILIRQWSTRGPEQARPLPTEPKTLAYNLRVVLPGTIRMVKAGETSGVV